MIRYEKALNLILSHSSQLEAQNIPTSHSVGRILAKDIFSLKNIPSFANSAMDGFAYRHQEFSYSKPIKFTVLGSLAAGDEIPHNQTAPMQTWEIMTGAPIPHDCDSVIKIEDTLREGAYVTFLKPGKLEDNIRKIGEDFTVGDLIAKKGTRLLPEHLMAMAALGISEVPVVKKPRVGVISTGAELSSNTEISSAKIRNSTAPYLLTELSLLGTEPAFLGTNADDPNSFLELIKEQAKENVDIIISTGAVSMGKHDFVATALRDLGAEIIFHKTAIRPGKPILLARIGKTTFFGIPGNPVSTAVGIRFFVEPYLREIQGLVQEKSTVMKLIGKAKKPEGIRCFFKARTSTKNSELQVEILSGQESFRIAPLLSANAWAFLPEEGKEIIEDSYIEVVPLHSWGIKEIF